jgi:hypothetical protein
MLKRYANYGLEHWGSDQAGVDKTRRFLLEWISFLYRYIPVGLLERLPHRLNERPPYFFGRNDLGNELRIFDFVFYYYFIFRNIDVIKTLFGLGEINGTFIRKSFFGLSISAQT